MTPEFKQKFEAVLRVYGSDAYETLIKKKITIIGLGGVGSWAFESLVRTGFHNIQLVDLDDICVSNTNRQIHTLQGTYGKFKIDQLKERALLINESAKIETYPNFYTEKTADDIFNYEHDFILDCIDSVKSKCHLIAKAKKDNIPLIVTGGAGGKMNPHQIQLSDLNRSFNDDLLMQVRKKLKREYDFPRFEKRKFHVPCLFSPEQKIEPEELTNKKGLNCQNGIGSLVHVTATMGFMAASYCTNYLLGHHETY